MFDAIATGAGGREGLFWELFATLSPDQIASAPFDVDLNVFPGSWRYGSGGAISRIVEKPQTAMDFVASIARAWLAQYAEALGLLDPAREESEFLLAGGLARRSSAIATVLQKTTGRRVLVHEGKEDETIAGLAALASAAG
jgi:hypothetical protein